MMLCGKDVRNGMRVDGYPRDIPFSVETFVQSPCLKTINEVPEEKTYGEIWQEFSNLAKAKLSDENLAECKIFWILSDVCSMMLREGDHNQPFYPIMILDGKRTFMISDLNEDDIELLDSIVNHIENQKIKARIADVLWVARVPRQISDALTAISAYTAVPISPQSWVRGGREIANRAFQISMQIGKKAKFEFDKLVAGLIEEFQSNSDSEFNYSISIANLFFEKRIAKEKWPLIAGRIEGLGKRLGQEGKIIEARAAYGSAAKWFVRLGNQDKAAEMHVLLGDLWLREGQSRSMGAQSSGMAAAHAFQNAIFEYRRVPSAYRAIYDIDEKLKQAQRSLSSSNVVSLSEMGRIETDPLDISELISAAEKKVSGKLVFEALRNFALISNVGTYKKYKNDVISSIKRTPLRLLVNVSMISEDGRIIAKSPGINIDNLESEDSQRRLEIEAISTLMMHASLIVQAGILPALRIINEEHIVQESTILEIVSRSSVFDSDRVNIVAKGIYSGIIGDFLTAIHLLAPQMEYLVRRCLKSENVITTTIDSDGIENEVGLSALLDKKRCVEILGEDVVFQIRAIFASPHGSNLRNVVAHGLMSQETGTSVGTIFAWWWVFRLIFIALLNGQGPNPDEHGSPP